MLSCCSRARRRARAPFTAVALLLVSGAVGATEAPPAQAAVCESCHGPKGAKPIVPSYPVIAGQYANFLAYSLKDYRSGARKNPLMNAQAAALTDADIAALARYYAEQESPLYAPRLPE